MNAQANLELFIVDKNDTSWSMRPWLLLVHHEIPFQETSFVAADPETPGRIAAISSAGRVPILRVGAELVWESLAIIEALAELHPESAIWPRDPWARRHARSIAAEMHAGFENLRRHCTMNLALRTRVEIDPARRRELDRFEHLVGTARRASAEAGSAGAGPFLFGEFCAADAMLAPVATRIRSYGLDVGPVTQAWCEAIFELPAFRRWEDEAAQERETRPPAERIGVPLGGSLTKRIPDAPCYAVVFTSQRRDERSDYDEVADAMVRLARSSPGYREHVSARGADGLGITVSYWDSIEAIERFRADLEHRRAQEAGRERYYDSYDLRVARVERRAAFARVSR